MLTSLIIGSFMRPDLLKLGLWSITQQHIKRDLEIIVLNDGLEDDTEKICNVYKNILNLRYIFTGQRNTKEKMVHRDSGFAMNIGVKQAKGDIIILAGAEMYHLNNTINLIINPLIDNKKILSVPEIIYFDDTGNTVNYLSINPTINLPEDLLNEIKQSRENRRASLMPFFMGMYKKHFINIGGYDEDFVGSAGDDNDFVNRLLLKGLTYNTTNAEMIHLYHGKRCDSRQHWNNPKWVYNYNLSLVRKDKIIRNENREWGKICGI